MTLIFIHVPKTAGSSFGAELQQVAQPSLNVFVDPSAQHPDQAPAAMRAKLAACAGQVARGELGLVAGHFTQADLTAAGVEGHRLTLLRDPARRVESHFHHSRRPDNPNRLIHIARAPTLLDFARDERRRDLQHRHLALHPKEPADEVADRLLNDFAFVGLTETYDRDLRRLGGLLGVDFQPSHRERVGDYERASADMLAAVAELNALDRGIYDRVFRALALSGETKFGR